MTNAGPAPLPTRRLGRAAKFAFGAAVATTFAMSGCGDDGMPMPDDTGTIAPAYGAVPVDTGVDAGPDASADTGPGDAAPDVPDGPLYGGPPADGG